MNIFTKKIYFLEFKKHTTCTDSEYINKYLWIYTSCVLEYEER